MMCVVVKIESEGYKVAVMVWMVELCILVVIVVAEGYKWRLVLRLVLEGYKWRLVLEGYR